ncbi:hypothetical protein ACMFMG_006626 [Clarireedia jacksonii]
MPEPKRNGNIRGFFKPVPPARAPGTRSNSHQVVSPTSTSTADVQIRATSSSPPVSSLSSNPVVVTSQSSSNISNGIVPGSDDEEDDNSSTCSLEDLSTAIWKTDTRPLAKPPAPSVPLLSTPRASRSRKPPASTFKLSPLASKTSNFKFDLRSLVSAAADDDALEERTKRVKALMESPEDSGMTEAGGFGLSEKHGKILQNIRIDNDEGVGQRDAQKVLKAVKRTEAMNMNQRWYFFETEPQKSFSKRQPFPSKALSKEWKDDLAEARFRHQTFVSGFAENMIAYGKQLPDEILLWILDEICVEELGDLRYSYCGIMKASSEQVRHLVTPEIVRGMFMSVGATAIATTLHEKIRPRLEVSNPYPHHHWSRLRSLLSLISSIAKPLQHEARLHTIILLLRMSADRLLLERADLLSTMQTALYDLCRYIKPDQWESSCQEICTSVFQSIDPAFLRLQIVQCIPCTSPYTHELRRRLSLAFYFNDHSKALQPPTLIIDLPEITQRLHDAPFKITPETDYHELGSLILLLDIAVDNGRSADLDLKDPESETQFNNKVDALAMAITSISISYSGAAYISRIEAKEVVELVGNRISNTVRSRLKPKHNIYDESLVGLRRKEDFGQEQKGMSTFMEMLKKKRAVEVAVWEER